MLFGATLFFAIGSSPIILMVARFLQGASCGIVFTVGLALLVDTVGRDEIGAWMGFALSGLSFGIMIGPFLGGIIYANAGYYAVFAVILGVIAFDFILRLFMIEKKAAARWTKGSSSRDGTKYGTFSDDANGSNPPISGDDHEPPQSDLLASDERTNDENLHNPWIHDAEPASTSHTKRPRMAKRLVKWLMERFPTTYALLSSPRLLAAMYGGFVQVSLTSSFESILPLFVQRTFRWDSSGTGAIFLTISIPSLASSLVGALSDRFGTRKVVLGGFAVSTIALALLSLVTHNSVCQIVLLCALLALIGKRSLYLGLSDRSSFVTFCYVAGSGTSETRIICTVDWLISHSRIRYWHNYDAFASSSRHVRRRRSDEQRQQRPLRGHRRLRASLRII